MGATGKGFSDLSPRASELLLLDIYPFLEIENKSSMDNASINIDNSGVNGWDRRLLDLLSTAGSKQQEP